MRPNASQQVRMDPNGSERIREPRKTCENLEKTGENFEQLREIFHRPVPLERVYGMILQSKTVCSWSAMQVTKIDWQLVDVAIQKNRKGGYEKRDLDMSVYILFLLL